MRKEAVFSMLVAGVLAGFVVSTAAIAAEDAWEALNTKVSYAPTPLLQGPSSGSELIFSAPPRETAAEATEVYGPVAAFLSEALGRKVIFQAPGNWGVYQGNMQKGVYDLVFDGAHFNGWRAAKIHHNVLLKVPGEHIFVVITKKGNDKVNNVSHLTGRTVCTHAPPNLGTLVFLGQFANPARQPVIINTKGWGNIYDGVAKGKCLAGVLPLKFLEKNDKAGLAKIVFRAETLPDNALSAGPRLSKDEQAKIVKALSSPAGMAATAKLRTAYAGGGRFTPAKNEEFTKVGEYLKNEWGYY